MNNDVQERILHTAYRLFYQNGYRATGINQIIEEAKVAKASFYHHFKSKEDLAIAYLELRGKIFFKSVVEEIDRLAERPIDKLVHMYHAYEIVHLRMIDLKYTWGSDGKGNKFYGCPYIKIDMESSSEKIKSSVKLHQKRVSKGIQFLLDEAVRSNELKEDTNTESLSVFLSMLLHGAIVETGWSSDVKYFQEASNAASQLLKGWSLVEI